MGRKKKKTTTNSKSNTNNRNKRKVNIDLAVIVLFVITILLFVLIYGEKGAIGEILSPALGGIIGFIKYIIPIGFLFLTVCIAKDDKNYLTSKLIQYVVLLSCIAATMSIYQISKGVINADLEFNDIIEVAYDLGVKNIGGGTVGVVIAYPLIKLLGMFGASVATIGVVAVLCVFTFGLHPSDILLDILDEMSARREEREQNFNSRRESRMTSNRRGQNTDQVQNQNQVESRRTEKKSSLLNFDEDEITININNNEEIETDNLKIEKGSKKIFGKKSNKKVDMNPEIIEANIYKETAKANVEASNVQMKIGQDDHLFAIEEEQKQTKTKAVLNLQHTISVEDENYEYPPVEVLREQLKLGRKLLLKKLLSYKKLYIVLVFLQKSKIFL